MSSSNPPVIGAALTVKTTEHLKDWLFDKDRDLEIQDFVFPDVLDSDWQDIVGRYGQLLDGFKGRIGLHGPFFGLNLAAIDPDIQAVVHKRLLQGLGVCEALGATQMVVHSPFTQWLHQNMDNFEQAKSRLYEACHANLDPVVARARDQGCRLVLENIEDVDPSERLQLVESFDTEVMKISVDTGHANCAHGSAGAPPVDYFVKSAGHLLDHVHIQDTDGYADRHWLPGAGTIPWPAVFEALRDYCDNPHLVIEVLPKHQTDIPACVARLEEQGLAQ